MKRAGITLLSSVMAVCFIGAQAFAENPVPVDTMASPAEPSYMISTAPAVDNTAPVTDLAPAAGGTMQAAGDGSHTEIYVAPGDVAQPQGENFKHFESWLDAFKAEALSKGISQEVLDDAFADVDEPSEDIVSKDKTQPEVKKTFPQYIKAVLTQRKIDAAREAYAENKNLLIRISNSFNVQPQFIVALWGLESNFGKNQGSTSIIQSLTTLAYDGRRAAFFRGELINALKIMQQEHIPSSELLGSWAGAMGQTQFMPTSFLKFAVDFDGDGKKDIWSSDADALASIANYLHQKGWQGDARWGIPVSLPTNTQMDWATMKENFPLSDWKKFGVRRKDGRMIKGVSETARLVMLDGDEDQAYLVFFNYDVLMDWNRSVFFATSVSMLADAIGDGQ